MITLTNFKGDTFTLNAMYIEKVESLPDTTITLVNGKKYFVKETEKEVSKLSQRFYEKIGMLPWHQQVGEESGK
ncbi:hypothetical protein GCM10012290_03030 [Halolactibacillus alkaliphilus]|uniref:Flagellar protein FlbD n=2 Tax=Halolactibacillus alkaliphilus TaxID=442899 RepID=A0A511WXD2_9BACI|nr:flagellar FlbD family protein [Halolactibacillus alkaliphilus]GEN55785.1 hypothetical protein HAL01_02490 [Halolactibacillus alkaliphilus]GGN64953.1 hypothetical protein GCM10012290_03030 [Halolactibacillus alkaliphilus]SFO64618.1 flagellar protein FlbD [Halolactibacillus alkaliphilus]